MTRLIGIYAFNEMEVLDFAGPYEVFTCASRVHVRRHPGTEPPFQVLTIGSGGEVLRARAGLRVLADTMLDAHPAVDVLIVPGGVVDAELANPALIAWLRRMAGECELVASICSGAILLAQAGLLDDKDATTHWEDIGEMRARFPQVRVHEERRWIDQGRVATSAGISAGIDMSLYLVQRLAGRELALATARQMEYHWRDA